MDSIGGLIAGDILCRHLANFAALRPEEKAAVNAVVSGRQQLANARRDIIREGEPPRGVILILSGWACRYKMLEDGRRQIVAFLVPGDMCDLHNAVLARMDHSIAAITAVRYVATSTDTLHRLSTDHPRVGQALWWQMLVNVAQQREWTLSLGQRTALERIGSLFCELMLRLQSVGLVRDAAFDFPLTQTEIAEATGLTSVHVNRTVQQLRASGLISLTGKVLKIPDFARLQEVSLFAPGYLHLGEEDGRGAAIDRMRAGG